MREIIRKALTNPPPIPYPMGGVVFMEGKQDMAAQNPKPANPEYTENAPVEQKKSAEQLGADIEALRKDEGLSVDVRRSLGQIVQEKEEPKARDARINSQQIVDTEKLRNEWHAEFTPEELKNADTRATIENAIELGYGPQKVTSKGTTEFKAIDVISNSLLGDEQRIEKAEGLLGPLSPKQQEALLKAHYISKGRTGKSGHGAGVYNLTREQIAQEARILKSGGFTDEQRRILIEAGLVAIPITDTYINPVIQGVVAEMNDEINRIGTGNAPDAIFAQNIQDAMTRVRDLRAANAGTPTADEANRLLRTLNAWMNEAIQAQGGEEENPLTREINRIKNLQKEDPNRRKDMLSLLRDFSPLSYTLPRDLIYLALEYDEAFESLVNRIVSLPLDKETSDYSLGLTAMTNLETMSDAITQRVDDETVLQERERLSLLKERFTQAQESFSLTHNMNKLIVTGDLQRFIQTAENILPPHLNYLQRLNGVGVAMRIYEETYDRYLAKYGWMYPFVSAMLHREVFNKLRELNDAGILGDAREESGELKIVKLEEWELRRAYNIARKFYNNTFRSSEKIATGTVPRNVEDDEKERIVAEIKEAINRGDSDREALLRRELADADISGQSRYSSFPLESAARIMNPIQLLMYRFIIAGEENGLAFLKQAKKNYLEFLRHQHKLGINKITTLGGVSVEEMEVGAVFGVSGFYGSWRTENIAISQMKVNIDGQDLTVRQWLANNVYEIEQAKKDGQVELANALKPLIDNAHVGLGMLLRQPSFGDEIGYEARKLLWEKIVAGGDTANSNPREGNLDVAINYLTGLKIQDGSIKSLDKIKSDDSGDYWDTSLEESLSTNWEVLRRKILLQHQKNIRKSFDANSNVIPDQNFDENETRLIETIKKEGRKLAPHLADIVFPYIPFMNDAPFEIFDYTLAGDEVYRRRVAGDIPSYFEGSNAFVSIVDNPGGIGEEKAMESFYKLERGIESPQGRKDAQKRTYPLFKAWLEWVMTKPGQRQEMFKAVKQTLLQPTSEAQKRSGMKAMSINEQHAREFIEKAVLANFLNEELAEELKKEKNLKFVGMFWALFRDMFATVLPVALVHSLGKEIVSSKQ